MRGVSSWLRIVERAAKVPCAMVIACGGVRVSAVPIFNVIWSRSAFTVSGASFRVKTELHGGEEETVTCASRRILAERGIDEAEYTVVPCGAREIYFRPRERCALCDEPLQSRLRTFVEAHRSRVEKKKFPEKNSFAF